MNSTTPELALEDIAERFNQWRLTKKPGDKIPQELWELAKCLKGRYKVGQLSKQLRVSTAQLRREGLALPPKRKKEKSANNKKFVNVNLNSASSYASASITPNLVVTRVDGVQLTLSNPSPEQLSLFIDSFFGIR